jgi:hypothetical protein
MQKEERYLTEQEKNIAKMNKKWLERDYDKIKKEQSSRNRGWHDTLEKNPYYADEWAGKKYKTCRG